MELGIGWVIHACVAQDYFGEAVSIQRRFRTDIVCSSRSAGAHPGPMDKACRGMNRTGRTHYQQNGTAINLPLNTRHFSGISPNQTMWGRRTGAACAMLDFRNGIVTVTVLYYGRAAVRLATRLEKLPCR